MNEMLQWVRDTFPMDLDTARMIEHKAESLLNLEKEQLLNAFDCGRYIQDSDDISITYDFLNAEEFYNKTYKS